jgi:hypothetical protein
MLPCKSGKERLTLKGRCAKTCSPGQQRNPITKRCNQEKIRNPCEPGKERSPFSGICVKICSPETFRSRKSGRCIKDHPTNRLKDSSTVQVPPGTPCPLGKITVPSGKCLNDTTANRRKHGFPPKNGGTWEDYEKNLKKKTEKTQKKMGTLLIGSLGTRGQGVSASPPHGQVDNTVVINTTSTSNYKFVVEGVPYQMKNCVSPFYLRMDEERDVLFENWWQGGKVWESQLVNPTNKSTPQVKESWKTFHATMHSRTTALRHPQKEFGLVGKPVIGYYEGVFYEYVASRLLYVREYVKSIHRSLLGRSAVRHLQSLLAEGKNVLLLDYDGPPASTKIKGGRENLFPHGIPLRPQTYADFARDPRFRFGHTWVLSAMVSQINPVKALEKAIKSANCGESVQKVAGTRQVVKAAQTQVDLAAFQKLAEASWQKVV